MAMKYLLDTDTLIYLIRGRHGLQERVNQAGITQCVISEISVAELYVGVYKSGQSAPVVAFLEKTFQVVPITSAVQVYARIRARLELAGGRLDDMDLFIAATALEHDYTLVTHNTRHFSRIPGLKLEDWIQDSEETVISHSGQ